MGPEKRLTLSGVFLLLGNAVPLAGVLFLEWKLLSVIMIYWAESAVVGIFSIFRMLWARGKEKPYLVPFFMFHYGFFMAGHYVAILIFALLTGDRSMLNIGLLAPLYADPTVLSAVAASFLSHGVFFLRNYIGGNEYLIAEADREMIRPYGRILVMHVAILASAFAIALTRFDRPVTAVVILIILKTVLDVSSHLRERRRAATS